MEIKANVDNTIPLPWLIGSIISVFTIAYLWIRSIGSDVSKHKADNDLTIAQIAGQFTQEYITLKRDIDEIRKEHNNDVKHLLEKQEQTNKNVEKLLKSNAANTMMLITICANMNIKPEIEL